MKKFLPRRTEIRRWIRPITFVLSLIWISISLIIRLYINHSIFGNLLVWISIFLLVYWSIAALESWWGREIIINEQESDN